MQNPKMLKMPKVREYGDSLFVNGHEIPWILLNEDGSTTTKAKQDGKYVKVTVTFLAKDYRLEPFKKIHGSVYKFKQKPWYKCLFSKLKSEIKRAL